ncbi:MAG: glycosyltransferase, partial [Patescibacteria group bacterium]
HKDTRAFIPHKKISMIPLGLGKTEFIERDSAREFFSRNNSTIKNKFLIGVTAELTKNKGISYLLQALRFLKDSPAANPIEVHTVIMGEGKERQRLEAQRQKLELVNDTSIIGFVPEAKQYLKAFDAFVLPSVKEGLPYAVMEAMEAGLPVVASHVGGIPDLVSTHTTGLLTHAKDPYALARHIRNIMDDENGRRAMGIRAQEKIAQSHSLEQMITSTANLYHELTQPYQ